MKQFKLHCPSGNKVSRAERTSRSPCGSASSSIQRCSLVKLEGSRLDLLHQALSVEARVIAIGLEKFSEAQVLGLQIPLLVRNQKPRDQSSRQGESSANKEYGLLALERV